jgi:hypothetical protein
MVDMHMPEQSLVNLLFSSRRQNIEGIEKISRTDRTIGVALK